jgi:hypothetical protein
MMPRRSAILMAAVRSWTFRFIIIPAGTPHWFSNIEGSITDGETRIPTKT